VEFLLTSKHFNSIQEFSLNIFLLIICVCRKLIHPVLISNEKIIDEYIEKAKNYSLQNTTMLLKILLKASSKILVRFMDDGQVYVRYFFKRKFEMTDIRKSDCLVKEETHRNDNLKLKNKINAVRIVEQGLEDAFEKNKF
jgi:hypothetical protein